MVSIRAKTPSGAAEVIPTPTEMDSRAAEIERRDRAMAGRAAEIERRDGDDGRRHDSRNEQSCGDSEPLGEGQKKGSAYKHCLSGRGKSTCP